MSTSYKFGYLSSGKEDLPFEYGDTWAVEKTTGPERLVIAPRSGHVDVMRALIERMPEPFYILYVFLVPRTHRPAGRYQSPDSVSREELAVFLNRFQKYFEGDGRHDIWILSAMDESLLVYDQHNVIYAYGPLDAFKDVLRRRNFEQVPKIDFPAPHSHHYNAELDSDQNALLDYWSWKVFPLTDQD